MGRLAKPLVLLIFGLIWVAGGALAYVPPANAQFGWFFQKKPAKKKRVRPARPPGNDLPPIKQRESLAPPPPDDRPYDDKLMRLAEILGAVHYLRELCGADEGQLWRDQMREILKNEGTTAVRRAKLVNKFNDGYRGYRRTYRTCTQSATLASRRFSTEGAQIASSLAQTSVFAPGPQVQIQDPAGQAASGQAASGQATSGQNPSGQDPAGVEAAAAGGTGAEPLLSPPNPN